MKTMLRSEFYLHEDNYSKLQEIACNDGYKSVSELIRHIVQNESPPEKMQKQKKNLTLDVDSKYKIKEIAEEQFRGNSSEALNHWIGKFLEKK